MWRGGQFVAFSTVKIGEEGKSALIKTPQQDDARGRSLIAAHGRERHRVRLIESGGERLLKPCAKLLQRLGQEVGFVETGLPVISAQGG